MVEKRSWKRVAVKLIAKCRPVDLSVYREIRITDIHQEGCCVKSEDAFEKDEELRLVIDIPKEGKIYLAGKVMWAEWAEEEAVNCAGIRFVIDSPVAEAASFKLYNFCMGR